MICTTCNKRETEDAATTTCAACDRDHWKSVAQDRTQFALDVENNMHKLASSVAENQELRGLMPVRDDHWRNVLRVVNEENRGLTV